MRENGERNTKGVKFVPEVDRKIRVLCREGWWKALSATKSEFCEGREKYTQRRTSQYMEEVEEEAEEEQEEKDEDSLAGDWKTHPFSCLLSPRLFPFLSFSPSLFLSLTRAV